MLGGGPAGAAVACGLKRLGEDVVLVSEPRRFVAVEGVSERVVEGLRHAGFERALSTLAPPSPRSVSWNGVASSANTERLLDRQHFDRALLHDVEAQGVTVWRGRVVDQARVAGGHEVVVEGDGERRSLLARFLVEARGRAAPGHGLPRERGVETVSLLQCWQGAPAVARSAVCSCEDGWLWMAVLEDGRRHVQLTLDVASAALPPRSELGEYCRRRFEAVDTTRAWLRNAEPVGEPYARTSTAVLNAEVAGSDWLRVGDAAMAVDPLSGNGIFQALSSALQAPAVVATLLHDPAHAALAQRFHQSRIQGLFYRYARVGRDFYAQESRWSDRPFWRERSGWPDAAPVHLPTTPDCVHVASMPVVEAGRIVEREVVVTPDQPLGVWHVDGVALAPLLRAVQVRDANVSVERALGEQPGMSAGQARGIAAWMLGQGWV